MISSTFKAPKIDPVEISILKRRNYLGRETGQTYGQISFWYANKGWYDPEIFHKVVNKRYVPNDLGLEVGIQYSSGGGSAVLEFNDKKLGLVIDSIQKAGYKTKFVEEK